MNDHSPAPSKEMKETKEKIWDCIIRYASTCMGEHDRVLTLSDKRTAIGKEIDELWSSLAVELGKEREAELAIGARINAIAFWCDNRHVVDYEEAFNIERDLLNALQEVSQSKVAGDQRNARCITQISELKRELAETVEVARKYQREVLALSASHQRQKDVLKHISQCPFPTDPEAAREIQELADAALAETPDVSLWQPIESASMPSVYPRRPYDDDQPNGYLESDRDWFENNAEACTWFLENAEKIRLLLSTLQPDHQK